MKYILLIIAPLLCYSQTIWSGSEITFTKANNADYTLEDHQDRITDDVWLTRNEIWGGALINFKQESQYVRGSSPLGTLWALGSTSDMNLSFDNFRDFDGSSGGGGSGSNSPPMNQALVLKITNGTTSESDDIHIDIIFTYWGSGKSGAFTYTRSTNPNLNVEGAQSKHIFVYPNPTSGVVEANQEIISQISVYDIKGQQIMISNASSVDLSAFKNGIYILNLYRSDTKNWVTRHIIKNHKI
ncbi:MAG: T9SS type A sorting domain-containing protein [Flavobacteriaceae bacterium]|nr:T9SS type A sorting domain-containing protein [Flavobacteriaceae bacterium]